MFAFRFVGLTEPALHAVDAILGSGRLTMGLDPITWYGILMSAGVAIDEARRWQRLRRERQRRQK